MDIVLMHALLNLNINIIDFLLTEGVPLRSVSLHLDCQRVLTCPVYRAHHLQAMEKLALPKLECIAMHTSEVDTGESERSVLGSKWKRQPVKKRKTRGKKKKSVNVVKVV